MRRVCDGVGMQMTFLVLCGLLTATLIAGPAEDMALIHVEAIGGPARIAALGAVKGMGHVTTGGKTVRFRLLAARPNWVRIETESGGRTLVQAYDGESSPWEFDTAAVVAVPQPMKEATAAIFVSDAEFDDPLIDSEARGYRLDVAGEATVDDRRAAKVLVTRSGDAPFFLLVDVETFFIVQRIDLRKQSSGRTAELVTRFDRFRPVGGVLLPHLIEVSLDGRKVQTTVIEAIEANPQLDLASFRKPESADDIKVRDEKARSKGSWTSRKKE